MATPKRPPRSLKGSGQVRLQRQKLQAQIREFVATAPQSASPGTITLVLTGFAPTVAAPVVVIPATAHLILTEFAPAVATPRAVTPATLSLTLTGLAPVVATPRVATPGRLALTLTTFAPTISIPRPVTVSPAAATLTLTGYPPDVQGDVHSGGFGHVVSDTGRRQRFAIFQGTEPPEPVAITPPTARLSLVGLPPVISSRSAVAFTLEELARLDLTAAELAAFLAA